MSYALRQQLVIAAGGMILLLVVVTLARRRFISLRYALGWSLIAVISLIGAFSTHLASPVERAVGISPTGFLLAVATVVLLAIALQLSITASGLQRQVHELAEAHALLASEVDELRHAQART
jgi:hypothetical protein